MAKKSHSETSVLLVNHHPLWLQALQGTLSSIPGVSVEIGLVSEELGADSDFDVVVLDPCFHGKVNQELVSRVRRVFPNARLVALTDCTRTDEIVETISRGIQSFILKSEPVETVRASIEAICRGVAVFSLPIAAVVSATDAPARATHSLPSHVRRGLSPREIEVLQMIARGYADGEIAQTLTISKRTVSRHVTSILNKLACRSRSQAVASLLGAEPPLAAAAGGSGS
jgi:DNA-binding NarL/FixJ family response regulator